MPVEKDDLGLPGADDRLRRIEAVTDVALGQLSVDRLLSELLERVQVLLAVDTVAVLLLDASAGQLVATAARGLEAEVRQGVRIPMGHGFAGRVAAEKRPVILPQVDHTTVLNPILWEHGIQSLLGVPLLVLGGAVVGVLHVGTIERRLFSDDEVQLLQIVADRMASAIAVRQAEAERSATGLLQRSLLPARLPTVAGLTMAARYVPAEGESFGGDWYDVFRLPSGGLCIVIGDVVGHGFAAAEVMGRLRNTLRAHALFTEDPAQTLERLDQQVRQFDGARMVATVQVAILEPALQRVRVSSAGHPLPVLASGVAPARLVEVPRDPPVGVVTHRPRRSITIDLAPGAVLCLYTDGLVERPDSPLDLNLRRLCEVVVPASPESVCRAVMNRLVGNQPSPDDVAILVLRREESAADPPGGPATAAARVNAPTAGAVAIFRHDLRLDEGPGELAVARDRFAEWLRLRRPHTTAHDELIVAVGEATANAYDHSGATCAPGRAAAWIQAAYRHGKVHVTVGDTGRWAIPTIEPGNRGRGRSIMAALTDHLELHTGPEGTVVELVKEFSVMTDVSTPPPPGSSDERLRITAGAAGEMVLAGDLDMSTVPQLREVLSAATTDPGAGMVVDLQQVGVLQSAGVAELFEQAEHRPLTVLVRTGSAVAAVLRVCGLDALARIELRPAPADSI